MKAKETLGHAGWEDENTPGKLSAWNLPTPGGRPSSRRREEDRGYRRSTRRDHQVYYILH